MLQQLYSPFCSRTESDCCHGWPALRAYRLIPILNFIRLCEAQNVRLSGRPRNYVKLPPASPLRLLDFGSGFKNLLWRPLTHEEHEA